jgi:hypothetical protein
MQFFKREKIFKFSLVSMALLMSSMLFGNGDINNRSLADEYFPLSVSNYWQFYTYDPAGAGYHSMEIVDQVSLDGDTYYKLMNSFFTLNSNEPVYLRNEGNCTYMYDSEDWDNNPSTSFVKLFDYSLEAGDNTPIYLFGEACVLSAQAEEVIDFLGVADTNIKRYITTNTNMMVINFAEGFGPYSFTDAVFSQTDLVGAVIANNEFGTPNNDNDIAATEVVMSNYPNPFNPETTIEFNLSKECSSVKISIYNIKGELVSRQVRTNLTQGSHSVVWNGKDMNNKSVASGIYYYKLDTPNSSQTKKMVLMK